MNLLNYVFEKNKTKMCKSYSILETGDREIGHNLQQYNRKLQQKLTTVWLHSTEIQTLIQSESKHIGIHILLFNNIKKNSIILH